MKPTREQILSEPAGPRLDAWVAEFVTKWEPTGLSRDMTGKPFPEPMPRYSQDIAAAIAVAEHLTGVVIEQWWEDGWAVYFQLVEGGSTEQVVKATLPEAISKAALLAR